MTTTTKRTRRSIQPSKGEPAYLWVPVELLAEQDIIVVLRQDAQVLSIAPKEGMWSLRILNLETHTRSEETYRDQQYIYTKSSAEVKTRLARGQNIEKGKGL